MDHAEFQIRFVSQLSSPHQQFRRKQRLRLAVHECHEVVDRGQFFLQLAGLLGCEADALQQIDLGDSGIGHLRP